MGVQGLWELLAPVGRRVSVETLTGKKLAIDASIWMIQFMKAMRDEKGEMVRNAHILGFFRRICKLLFLRTKPVFVFDGATPALKRRTVVARRRQRENAQTKIRKTAEKLLLNHLKAMKLKELADDIEKQKQKIDSKGKKVVSEDNNDITNDVSGRNDMVTGRYNQESLDELLAASLAAEENGNITANASTSIGGIPSEEDDSDEEEEMIFPVMDGKVDPAVLAALPPSMQLDLLVQMRERLMAENRQKYQKVNKAPAKFSELQIQAYLKTVAFRREINEVQKSAAGRGVGGVQSSRIASEANREFIFSSSFTGDKQMLTPNKLEKNGNVEHQIPEKEPMSSDSVNCIPSTAQSTFITEPREDDHGRNFDDVETYLDERGRIRVSRVRAMGIHMTRDLQRNLDLMKETELEKMTEKNFTDIEAISSENPENIPKNSDLLEASNVRNEENIGLNNKMDALAQDTNHQSILGNKTAMEISFFEDDSGQKGTDDDDLFAHLVAGSPVLISSADNAPASDSDWEEGIIEEKGDSFSNDIKENSQPSFAEGNISDENDMDWEEGVCNVPTDVSPCPTEQKEFVSKGCLEEEADIQEAIKRSLKDFTILTSTEDESFGGMINQGTAIGFPLQVSTLEKESSDSLRSSFENDPQQSQSSCEAVASARKLNTNDSQERQFSSSIALENNNNTALVDKPCYELCSTPGISSQETNEYKNDLKTPGTDQVISLEPVEVHLTGECMGTSKEGTKLSTFTGCTNDSFLVSPHISPAERSDLPNFIPLDTHQNAKAAPSCHSFDKIDDSISREESSTDVLSINIDNKNNRILEKNYDILYEERVPNRDKSATHDEVAAQVEVSQASLDEEIRRLGQERINLGDEQRKLERNAESVSSEMFAECQELLQMFGLPYIIAPMEAEAQCAYMELANLVDGVVTDDSDVFLFGAQSVYKNIFDDRKYVETYFMKDIKTELGLTREKLIRIALLLGSDYTEGVSGIGIVNAIEVVNAFPEEDGLQEFREWLESPDPSILGKLDAQKRSGSRKRGSKLSNNGMDCLTNVSEDHDDEQLLDDVENTKQIFMEKHRKVSKNWHIPTSFPSETVISAYNSPEVDKSTEPFSWGKPDLFVLRKLCWEKFGWSNQKADDLLVPVLKEYNKHETQLRLEAFYTFNERFAKIRSQRIKKAVKGITGKRSLELTDDQEVSKSEKRRRESPTGPEGSRSEDSLNEYTGNIGRRKSKASEKSTPKQSRKRRMVSESVLSEEQNPGQPIQKDGRRNTKKGSTRSVRGRGKGRVGRGKEEVAPGIESSETSSSDGNKDNDEQEIQVEKIQGSYEVRRSTRQRKLVFYKEDDLEVDGQSNPVNQTDEKCTDDRTEKQNQFQDEGNSLAPHDLNKKKQQNETDPFLDDGVSSDYLEMGGGFCMNDGESQPDPVQLGSDLTRISNCGNGEDESSGEYLKKGGGFCMDENESASSPPKDLKEPLNGDKGEISGIINQNLDYSGTKFDGNPTSVGVKNLLNSEKADSGAISTTGLSAMPFLRRKRRKKVY